MCQNKEFTGVKGTTSLCKGSVTESNVCTSLDARFDEAETNPQGLICEGPDACLDTDAYFLNSNNKKTKTITCKGGIPGKPACDEVAAYGGCVICDGPNSCFTVYAYENSEGIGSAVANFEEAFEGYLGYNCPKKKKADPSLPCFSNANTVEVLNKGIITLNSLKIGDHVKTGTSPDGQSFYSPVISFMHLDHHAEVTYFQIFTSASCKIPLEISGNHLLYRHDDSVVRAQDVQIGDILKGDTTNMVVTHVKNIQRQGLYAPATENGKIWVSGVTASSYISLFNNDIISPNIEAMVSHMALAPLRVACNIGSFLICQSETYSEDGFSMNLLTLINFGHRLMTLKVPMQLCTLLVVAPLLLVLGGMEMTLNHGVSASMWVIGIVVTISMMKTITKVKTAK
jgi:hypothetical protein